MPETCKNKSGGEEKLTYDIYFFKRITNFNKGGGLIIWFLYNIEFPIYSPMGDIQLNTDCIDSRSAYLCQG